MKYRVTALMTVMLSSIVEADSVEDAVTLGKAEAESGRMDEVDQSGEIHSWETECVRTEET